MTKERNRLFEAIQEAVQAEVAMVHHASHEGWVRVDRAWVQLYEECKALERKIDAVAGDPPRLYA